MWGARNRGYIRREGDKVISMIKEMHERSVKYFFRESEDKSISIKSGRYITKLRQRITIT